MISTSDRRDTCWCDAPARLELGKDEVHVWRAMLTVTEPVLEAFRSTLSPDERAKADRFCFARDRDRSIAARAVLRMILSRYLDVKPAHLRFSYNRFGKPALGGERSTDALHFNVSHSGELALVAVTQGQEIGVDVEHIRENFASEEIAEQFFSPREVAMLRALPSNMRTRGFFNCWTRKEAYIKARGEGLSLPLDRFDVSLSPREPAALLSVRESKLKASRWSLRELTLGPCYAAAIAVQGHDWQLKCWHWDLLACAKLVETAVIRQDETAAFYATNASSQPNADPLATCPALQCAGLIKRYGDVTAVDGLDIEVAVGECFGLLGPNGAGKTTTVEILEGLTEPDLGTVRVFGYARGTGHDRALRNRMGVQLQETQFADKVTVEETIRLFRSFYSDGSDIDDLIRTVELQEKRSAYYAKLSSGQKQRLALACALVNKPDLLFLDEPTTGLDPQARLKLWEIIEQFQAAGGTVFLTTHYMEEAALLCDRVAIMDHGRVIALGTPTELVASLNADQIVEFSVTGELDERSLIDLPGVRSARRRNGDYLLSVSDIGVALPSLVAALQREHVRLLSLATHQPTLEDVFVNLTGRRLRDG